MKNLLLLLFTVSLFSAGFVSAACAHVGSESSEHQVELNIEKDSASPVADSLASCDVHCHNHVNFADLTQVTAPIMVQNYVGVVFKNAPPALVYGLKRPPKI